MSGWCRTPANASGNANQYNTDIDVRGNIDDCERCVDKTLSYKTIEFPCTRNSQQMVTEQVARTVQQPETYQENYQEMQQVAMQRPVVEYRNETTYKNVPKRVKVTKTKMEMEDFYVKKRVPKTTWVDVDVKYKRCVPKKYQVTEMRSERVPQVTSKPIRSMKTVYVNKPVTKTRTATRYVNKTVYDNVTRPVCKTETKMCKTQVPVYKVVVRPPGQCRQGVTENFDQVDTNNDGVIDAQEFQAAQQRAGMNMGPAQHRRAGMR